MDDEAVLRWLSGMTTYIANLHQHLKQKPKPEESNAGPRYHEHNVHEAFDEGFARWMGYRGEEAQEREFKKR